MTSIHLISGMCVCVYVYTCVPLHVAILDNYVVTGYHDDIRDS